MYSIVIGVDIAKQKFDVASLANGKYKHQVFANNSQGYQQVPRLAKEFVC